MGKQASVAGITLIELCMALAIASLLAGLAAPGLRESLRDSAIRSAAYDLMAAIQQVRSSSIVEARPGFLCLTAATDACTPSANDRSTGWRTYLQSGGRPSGAAETVPGTQGMALASRQLPAGLSLRATRDPLRFLPGALAASTGTLTICDDARLVPARKIIISNTGRARLVRGVRAECP